MAKKAARRPARALAGAAKTLGRVARAAKRVAAPAARKAGRQARKGAAAVRAGAARRRGGKHVYFFGNGKADGDRTMRDLLGGKGANLAEMSRAGLPVPPGFTI